MIISRTPFRASFLGGSSDLPWYYERYGGAVISAAIAKYMYVTIHPFFGEDRFRLKYSKLEDVDNIEDIQHPIIRSCLERVPLDGGMEIASIADVPAGTGLGSSSSFTVGLLNVLYAQNREIVLQRVLAEQACDIEINVLKSPIGKQDQYAAAFGGLNVFRFNQDGTVTSKPVNVQANTIETLERQLRFYYIGGTRDANRLLERQKADDDRPRKAKLIAEMVRAVDTLSTELEAGNAELIGPILDEAWQKKRALTDGITNDRIDQVYKLALQSGATGGKLLGAGQTGFLLLCHPDHDALARKLGLKSFPLKIDFTGTTLTEIGVGNNAS
jgi:D-glycero-alpha-D-manno-heptose-7-phosphate kinase